MKKIISLTFVLVFMLSLVSAVGVNSGSIWTTKNDCGEEQQNVNLYEIGEEVYINGANFGEGDYEWSIRGLGGSENSQASCDPSVAIVSGSYEVDGTGDFCFKAYVVQNNDCGNYKAYFDNKHDNYHVVPEFGFFIGVLTLLGAVGVFFLIRRE